MRQFAPKKIWIKGIALFVAGLFLTETVLWAAPAPFADVVRAAPGNSRDGVRADALLEKIQIPPSLGAVQEVFQSPVSSPVSLVYLEDAHGEPEAQKNIEAILNHLNKEQGIRTFFLEGAWSRLDPALLQFAQDSAENQKILEALTQKGIIGGPENFLWGQSSKALSPVQGFGIEDLELYKKNLEQFRAVIHARKESEAFLNEMKAGLLTQASQVLSPELADYFRKWSFHEEIQNDYSAHLRSLADFSEKHLKLDLRDPREQYDWPQLVRFQKLKSYERATTHEPRTTNEEEQRLVDWLNKNGFEKEEKALKDLRAARDTRPVEYGDARQFFESFYEKAAPLGFRFKDYPALSREWGKQILVQELDAPSLLKEIQRLEALLLEKLAGTQDEKKLITKYREYLLLKKLLNLELTKEEWQQIRPGAGERSSGGTGFILGAPQRGLTPMVSQVVETARQFYQTAEARDAAMFARMLDWIKKEKIEKAAIITGGFHSNGLGDLLKKKEISYVRVRPKISKIHGRQDYLKFMAGESHLRGVSAAEPGITAFPDLAAALPKKVLVESEPRSESRAAAVGEVLNLIDKHDIDLARHSRRVSILSRAMAQQLFPDASLQLLQDYEDSGLLHDAGKTRLTVKLLKKRAMLSPWEKKQKKSAPEYGAQLLARYPELEFARDAALHHHERMDGKGYPYGLRGEAVPFLARVIAVADYFDVLVFNDSRKPKMPWRQALSVIMKNAGVHFDRQAAEALKGVLNEQAEGIFSRLEDVGMVFHESSQEAGKRSENRTNSISAVIRLLETHYRPLGQHSRMVGYLSQLIAAELSPRLAKKELQDIADAGLLHDAGKVKVPLRILKKPGKLNKRERKIMEKHPEDGVEILKEHDNLKFAAPAVLHHHEHWRDGKGYPYGIQGERIPLAARIVAVADAFDALISPRSYKKGKTWWEAWEIIARDAGTHFDPQVVIAFHRAILKLEKNSAKKNPFVSEKKLPQAFRQWVLNGSNRSEIRVYHPLQFFLNFIFRGEEQVWRETYNGIDPRSPREEELIAQSIKAVHALKEPAIVNFVVPMHKEEKRLAPRSAENPNGENALLFMVQQLEQLRLVNPLFDYKLTLVDDGSPDEKTYAMAQTMRELLNEEKKAKIKILRISPEEKKKMGSRKGGAVLYGMRHALQNPVSGAKQLVGYTDVDDSANLMLTGLLLEPLISGKADASAAARRGPGAESRGRSIAALVSSRLYNRAIRFMLPDLRGIYDTQTGFKLFTEEALASVLPWMKDHAWSFDSELLSLTAMHGFQIAKPPIAWFDSRDASQFSHRALQNGKEALVRVYRIQRPQVVRFQSLVKFLKKNRYFHLDDLRREIPAYRDTSEEAIFKEIRAVGRRKLVRLPKGNWEGFYRVFDPQSGQPNGFVTSYSYKHTKRTPEGGPVHFPSVSVFVMDENARLLIQQRPVRDGEFAMDASATGHVEIDETPVAAALHELSEELGIEARAEDLTPVLNPDGRSFFVKEMPLAIGGYDAAIRHAFVLRVSAAEMGWQLFRSRARGPQEGIDRFEAVDFAGLTEDLFADQNLKYEPGLRFALLNGVPAKILNAAKLRSEIRDPVEDKVKAILKEVGERELHMSDVTVTTGLFEPTDPGFMKAVERRLEINPDRQMTLLDIGHGQGLFGLRLALKYPRLKIIGVELHHGLFDSSRRLVAAAEKLGFIRKGQVQYFGGDFFDSEFHDDIQSADLVYYYNQSFSDEDVLARHLASHLKTNARVVIYASLPDEDEWDELIDEDDSLGEFDYRRDDEEDALPGNLLLRGMIQTGAFHHVLPDDEIQSIQVLEKLGARKRSEARSKSSGQARSWLPTQDLRRVLEIEKTMDDWSKVLARFSAVMPQEKFWVKNTLAAEDGTRKEEIFKLSFGQWLFRHHYGNLAQSPVVMLAKLKSGRRPSANVMRQFRAAVKQIRHGMPAALTVLGIALEKIKAGEFSKESNPAGLEKLGTNEDRPVPYQAFIRFLLYRYMEGKDAPSQAWVQKFKENIEELEALWPSFSDGLEEIERILALNQVDWSRELLKRYQKVRWKAPPVRKVSLVYDEQKTRMELNGKLITFYYNGEAGWETEAVLNAFETRLRHLGFAPQFKYETDSRGQPLKPMILVLDDKDIYFRPVEALYGKDYQIIKVKRLADAIWAVKNLPRFSRIISDMDLLGSPFKLLTTGSLKDIKAGRTFMLWLNQYFKTTEGQGKIPYGDESANVSLRAPAPGTVVLHSTSFENLGNLLAHNFRARVLPQLWNPLAWFKWMISPLDRILAIALGRSPRRVEKQVPAWVTIQPKSVTFQSYRSEARESGKTSALEIGREVGLKKGTVLFLDALLVGTMIAVVFSFAFSGAVLEFFKIVTRRERITGDEVDAMKHWQGPNFWAGERDNQKLADGEFGPIYRSETRELALKAKLFKPARAETVVREAIEEMAREIRDGDGRVLVEWQNANGNKTALANFFVRDHLIQGQTATDLAKQIVPRLHSSPPLENGEFFAVSVIPFGRPEIVFSRRSEARPKIRVDLPAYKGGSAYSLEQFIRTLFGKKTWALKM